MRKNLFITLYGLLLFFLGVTGPTSLLAMQPSPMPQISFKDEYLSVKETKGSVQITLLLQNPGVASVDLVLKGAPFSTTDATDVNFTRQTLHFTSNSNATQTITIPLRNDAIREMDEYFVLSLENLKNISLAGKPYLTVYIKDNERQGPHASKELELEYISSFKPNSTEGSTTEIVVHDPATQRLFMTSAIQNRLDIADFSNPAAVKLIKSIDMTPYGGITSVAVKNGVVAVASPNADEQKNGSVVFFSTNGDFKQKVTVGALPDMITFTPDGKKILTANEGQPNDEYTVDPEGSISIIDISGGLAGVNQSKVNTLLFTGFNAKEASLLAAGVRKTKATSTLSRDFEPEYVTVAADSKKAWVTLQENNAMAEINLENKTITSVWAFGTKDFSLFGNGFDASDKSKEVHLANYPVKSFYLPDAVANFKINNKTYLVTANEGDEKEYEGLNERTTVGDVVLDPVKFPNAAELQQDYNLGRLRITNLQGDPDNDGDQDELYMVGARSFSIWDAATKTLVYDSKDNFEFITATDPSVAPIFNADNEDNDFKGRSRAKGPEPEGITIATIKNKTYAFITLERIGGVMVYDVTNPNKVKFIDYKNNRSLTEFAGDHGPEGIIYISEQDSPDQKNYIAVANEISGTIILYGLKENPPARTLVSFAPQKGLPGVTVTLTDKGLGTTTQVLFNGQEAKFKILSDTEVLATVPASATTGPITLKTAGGTVVSSKDFTVLQPTMSFFAPEFGAVGSKVVLWGEHLGTTQEVYFNGVKAADFNVYFGALVIAEVPENATSGKISVLLAGGGKATSDADFIVVPAFTDPVVASSEPEKSIQENNSIATKPIAFPNPFSGALTIQVQVTQQAAVTISIYSNADQKVKELDFGMLKAGQHRLSWDGTDTNQAPVKPGLYLYQVHQNNQVQTGRILKGGSL
ncbi:choice-of-anchor I family protein [Adhaeribacter pallidiroseus]|uniref:Alkaline phosphatase n=1 Tax=Adhaeribacter pallidiroseus TaxID=2072847 RepID=A0A369QAA0_9BACT|nr:choice-of-anchor I family protein [Adhaeribacter pallidiroseus]RDC61833.1 hypothetical protein AHMF7616_00422 [Adhaeribacter pallidiroseus]